MVVVHNGWDSAVWVDLCEPAQCADESRKGMTEVACSGARPYSGVALS